MTCDRDVTRAKSITCIKDIAKDRGADIEILNPVDFKGIKQER